MMLRSMLKACFFVICIVIWGRIYVATAGNEPDLSFVMGFEDMYITF